MAHGGFDASHWAGPDGEVGGKVIDQSERCLRAYRENPLLIEEHANIERATAQGGYGRRQIYELVQNGADELIKQPGGRIHVLLTKDALYCANEGRPVSPRGVEAILSAALSVKRGDEIGRFGMGFKSVLGVTDLPDFFSHTGSFRFDAHWAEKRIREIKADAERTPVLRIAYPLDPAKASSSDAVLRELMTWASTVVRLPIDRRESHWLPNDIEEFPREFLLFSPHVGELTLEDRVENVRRSIKLSAQDDTLVLSEGKESTSWKVFRTTHQPSKTAKREAGELADRPRIPLVWAVPTEGRARLERGTFWAFFPTHYRTTLSGILNAPWKTNEDRQNLLEGPFNEELLDEASRLIAKNLASLSTPEDPAAHLDLMPARGREAPNWADQRITEKVYELAAEMNSLPDQHGILRHPAELECHPSGLPTEAVLEWAAYPRRPKDWCHHTVDSRERRPRAERLLNRAARLHSSLRQWLEALVEDESSEASIAALRTAHQVLLADANLKRDIQTSKIVLTNKGTLEAPNPDVLTLPGEYVSAEGDLLTVHPEVIEDPIAKLLLLELDLREGDPLQELRTIIARSHRQSIEDWDSFWRLVRRITHLEAVELLQNPPFTDFVLYARAMDGEFRPVHELLVPGPVVSRERGEDFKASLDDVYHEVDLDLLVSLGVTSAPRAAGGFRGEEWFQSYLSACRAAFVESVDRNPQWTYLVFNERTFAGPLSPLLHLSEEGRARFTAAALAADPKASNWVMTHKTRPQDYPAIEMRNPMIWLILEEGRLHTSMGVKRPFECVSSSFKEWSEFFPVALNLSGEQEESLGLPIELEELDTEAWKQALKTAGGVYDDLLRGRFYALACRYRPRPRQILARIGKSHQLIDPREVTVVADRREMEALADQGTPTLLCNHEGVAGLVERWRLASGESKVRSTVEHVPASSPVPLVDRWPLLGLTVPPELRDLEVVPCESLRRVTVTHDVRYVDDVEFHIEDSRIFHDASTSERDLLRRISHELDLGLPVEDLEEVIHQRVQQDAAKELQQIAAIKDPADRLLSLVGLESLRRLVGPSLLEGARRVRGKIDDRTTAELVLAAHGVNTLKVLQHELQHWSPPAQWAGSKRAKEFVASLGFEPEYAGFAAADRDAVLPVDGPLRLPALHDYQRSIADKLRKLLVSPSDNRGLVSLPTGAGKTRVVVQTILEAYKDEDIVGPILWVAQSDELCEQAVQAWREVWRSEGPEERMQINRLWGSNEAAEAVEGFQVVVATIQKLRERVDRSDYEWLWQARCLVIDEAHRSVTPEYTALLGAFGMGRGKIGIPLIGLSATPFRGENERETKQLVSRYGEKLIQVPGLGHRPYETLQNMGVLAKVEHEMLQGSEIQLTNEEREHLKRFERMPASVEDRLAQDEDRNAVLIESITKMPEDWTILLFSTSVEHAQNLAALLSLEGVPARAISAETEDGARRHYVNEFRRGRIRVLTNYNVLAQGFDAPAVRAVYVARPTFSTNLYQQMIGRGLRGPLNGGSEICRIVNVEDNFLMYGDELAFHHFDYLWDQGN